MAEQITGTLGEMGPEATMELFRRVLDLTPAKRDQDHIHVIVDSNPKIPDRTMAILGKGESPLPMMITTAETLESAGG